MGLDQDKRAAHFQVAPGSLEGMDHALDRDSSKRPVEQHNLEWFGTKAKLLGRADAEGDVADAFRRFEPSGKSDFRRIWFDGHHLGGERSELARQTAISASDLEDPATLESYKAPDEPDLHPRRRIVRAGLNASRHREDARATP